MNRLSRSERAQIIRALVEGNSIRSTVRMTGFAKNTITKLLVQVRISLQSDHLFRSNPISRFGGFRSPAREVPSALT